MPHPTVQKLEGRWTEDHGAEFRRTLLGQTWTLNVPPNGWVTIYQAALLLELSVGLVTRWVREGKWPKKGLRQYHAAPPIYLLRLTTVRLSYEQRTEYDAFVLDHGARSKAFRDGGDP